MKIPIDQKLIPILKDSETGMSGVEISEKASLLGLDEKIVFVPHLVPLTRGMLASIYCNFVNVCMFEGLYVPDLNGYIYYSCKFDGFGFHV